MKTTASRHKLAAVISWPQSPNLEITTNLKAGCNRKWFIIIILCFLLLCFNTVQSLICLFGPIKLVVANL